VTLSQSGEPRADDGDIQIRRDFFCLAGAANRITLLFLFTSLSMRGALPERTCFQTGNAWSPKGNLGSDVAIVYGIDADLPKRIQSWREHGYRIHVMTGVSWGNYQDYLYGRFDGTNHEDEAQTDKNGRKIGHGGDVYYMCPGENYGKFLCVGVQRALDAGAEAIHLEEPEFWTQAGYSEGFKREWKSYYGEDWQPPHSSVDAHWRGARLKYFLYRRALQQIFDYVQDYNRKTGRSVRCYVPTHSLLNYAQWGIVSPELSLAQLNGCDGYIAQVWTGTARNANVFEGRVQSRTFETAFLEYGAMRNLVRGTGRTVFYLNDPVEDDPNHDWNDYRDNWESTMVASLFQPDVWQYEVAPWPERVFAGRYPASSTNRERCSMPSDYATEVQVVANALNNMHQRKVEWDCGTRGIGVVISDSLMFQRGEPDASDPHLGNFYGLAMPLVKRGIPVMPVQLESITLAHYLENVRLLLLSYDGQKPLSPDVHGAMAKWVKAGGTLIIFDADADPFLKVREWWNTNGRSYTTPREHLFEELGLPKTLQPGELRRVKKGSVLWIRERPVNFTRSSDGATKLLTAAKLGAKAAGLPWRESNYLRLQRGPYIIASGLDESVAREVHVIRGKLLNLFDPELRVQKQVKVAPGSRYLLLDLESKSLASQGVLAAACKVTKSDRSAKSWLVEGVDETPACVLLRVNKRPLSVTLDGKATSSLDYSPENKLLWIRFENEARPRQLTLNY
jgi:hypothetical protein